MPRTRPSSRGIISHHSHGHSSRAAAGLCRQAVRTTDSSAGAGTRQARHAVVGITPKVLTGATRGPRSMSALVTVFRGPPHGRREAGRGHHCSTATSGGGIATARDRSPGATPTGAAKRRAPVVSDRRAGRAVASRHDGWWMPGGCPRSGAHLGTMSPFYCRAGDQCSLTKILSIASAPTVMTGRIWWR